MEYGQYTPQEVIGHGSFGIIRKVKRNTDGVVLARKEIAYKSMNQKERTQLIAEFRILKSLHHPNIVQYLHHEHVSDTQEVHLYMEYCGGGDLASVIRRLKTDNEYATEAFTWRVFTQLILALYRCHFAADAPPVTSLFCEDNLSTVVPQSFVLHRDIKPENIFLADSGLIKLGDFGLAKLLDGDNPLANTYVGTPYYMSPEVLTDQPSTPASDIWSLGCVIYELCAGFPPFQAKSHHQLSQKIREGQFKPLPAMYSQTLARTVAACLSINPAHRPNAATLLKLDVIKLVRRELNVEARERRLAEREDELDHAYSVLEREIVNVIDDEVNRRIANHGITGDTSIAIPVSPIKNDGSSGIYVDHLNPADTAQFGRGSRHYDLPPLARRLSLRPSK